MGRGQRLPPAYWAERHGWTSSVAGAASGVAERKLHVGGRGTKRLGSL